MTSILTETLAPESIRQLIDTLPQDPGVYLMKNAAGQVLYVGKALNLRNRVRSYFSPSGDERAFVTHLGTWLADIETIVTRNEKEALLLENTLIKQYKPRFNIRLADDKNYLVLRLDKRADFPRLEVVRQLRKDGARYFGPYHSAASCRQTLDVINRHFKLRTCSDGDMKNRTRPCLQYQIKRCDAPCVFDISKQHYSEHVNDVILFLEGRNDEVLQRLQERMNEAAESMEYETAAMLRDQIQALEKTLEKQQVVSSQFSDQDVVGFYRSTTDVEMAMLQIRLGKLVGRKTYLFRDQEFPDQEILSSFVNLYYNLGHPVPEELLLPFSIEEQSGLQEWLDERRAERPSSPQGGKRVRIGIPEKGPRSQLVDLAQKNAAAAYQTEKNRQKDHASILEKLQKRLGLKQIPHRIECFDISHLQGTSTVASRVVFVDGQPDPSQYRMFRIQSSQNDDFASMYEVISRRLRRGISKNTEETATDKTWRLPNLIVIDGGKGQLGSAMAAIKDMGLNHASLDVVGLAKEREDTEGSKHPDRVFVPGTKDPIRLRQNTAELFLLSHIRDEAHRFAVRFHRKRRAKKSLDTALDHITGIGPKRRKSLLRVFGSVKRIQACSQEQLMEQAQLPENVARHVFQFFHSEAWSSAPSRPSLSSQDRVNNAALQEIKTLAETEQTLSEKPTESMDNPS